MRGKAVVIISEYEIWLRFEGMPPLVFKTIFNQFKGKFACAFDQEPRAEWNGRYWVLPKSEERAVLLFCYRLLGRRQVGVWRVKDEPPTRFEQGWVQGRLF